MTEKKPTPMREGEAIELLQRKLSGEGYLVVPQVGNATGFGRRRTADAIALQTWPSRGLSITGIEYKRTRADWRRELAQGDKAEPIAAYCHYWVILAPAEVVPREEVPPGWGLWEFDVHRRLLRTKPPPPQEDVKPIDLSFLCAILRAAEKVNRNSTTLEADRAELQARMSDQIKTEVDYRTRNMQHMADKVQAFEEASGIDISAGWNHEKLGAGMREYMASPDRFTNTIKQQQVELARLLTTMDEALGHE